MGSSKAMLLILTLTGLSYAIDSSFESFVQSGHAASANLAQDDNATKSVPQYSSQSASQVGNNFAVIDDEALKKTANQKILSAHASQDTSAETIIVQSFDRKEIDNFEKQDAFEKAEKILEDPISLLKQITEQDCHERLNTSQNHYTKHTLQEEKTDIDYEERVCEKPTDNVTCERTLDVKCDAMEECEMGGIVKGSLDTGMEWDYTYPNLRLGTVGTYYFYCGQACRKETRFANFKVQNKDAISSFRIKKLFLNNLLMIKLNGTTVYNSLGGDRLEIANINDSRSHIDAGLGKSGHCEINAGRQIADYVDIDLLPYLKEGENRIDMELVYSFYGHIHFEIEARQQCCTKLADKWETRCWQS
jgi:hypothetical protein